MNRFALLYNILFKFKVQIRTGHLLLRKDDFKKGHILILNKFFGDACGNRSYLRISYFQKSQLTIFVSEFSFQEIRHLPGAIQKKLKELQKTQKDSSMSSGITFMNRRNTLQ